MIGFDFVSFDHIGFGIEEQVVEADVDVGIRAERLGHAGRQGEARQDGTVASARIDHVEVLVRAVEVDDVEVHRIFRRDFVRRFPAGRRACENL